MGICACLLIALFIGHELGYDRDYAKGDRIFRVVMQGLHQGEVMKSTHFPWLFADALEEDFPEILKAGRVNTIQIFGAGKRGIHLEGTPRDHFDEGFILADQEAFEILEINLVQGNPQTALTRPEHIVLSQKKADKYFPGTHALGRTLYLDNDLSRPYTVSGVMRDRSGHSHLPFDFLLPIADTNPNWTNQNYFTYVLVAPNTDLDGLEQKMSAIVEKYIVPAQLEQGRSAEFIETLKTIHYSLQPVADIHLRSDMKMQDPLKHGDIKFVWLFLAIVVFVLLLAMINFINLSTAKSAKRAKEVGLRKTIGAHKSNLIGQFLTESLLYSLISFVLALVLARVLLPTFNVMAGKAIEIPWTAWWFLPALLAAALLVGLLAGLYPAFYLSSFRPVEVLKGRFGLGRNRGNLRSALVIFQFNTSVVPIIGTLIIYRQMDFIMDKDLGYDREQLLVLEGTKVLGDKMGAFKEELLSLAQVKNVSVTNYLPIDGGSRNGNIFRVLGADDGGRGGPAQIWPVEQRKKEISIRMVLGAPFSGIYQLLTLDFVKLVVISICMAIPIGWSMMARWLEDFAYHIEIGWELFFTAAVLALGMAVMTIGYQSIRAALARPVKGLRTE